MKKVIVMSVQSHWLAKILNGEKTVEIRTRVPKDFVGEIHLACTKGKPYLTKTYELVRADDEISYFELLESVIQERNIIRDILNGKVVAKFTLEKVSEYPAFWFENTGIKELDYIVFPEDKEKMCLEDVDLKDYGKGKTIFAWHITNLVVFDKPRELGEYYKGSFPYPFLLNNINKHDNVYKLTKAPQSYQYCFTEGE